MPFSGAWRLAALRAASLLAVGGSAGVAVAAGPIGPNGTPILTSDYAIDLYQGPVFAGARVTGLAGAYVAISEDVDGNLQNPAAPGVRPFYSIDDFDYAFGFGMTFPAALANMDFYNSGSQTNVRPVEPDSFVFLVPAANVQSGRFGLGATFEIQQYALTRPAVGATDQARFIAGIYVPHLQGAYRLGTDWVFGVGIRVAWMNVQNALAEAGRGEAFDSIGVGGELGVVYRPEGQQFRLGAAIRSPVRSEANYRDSLKPDVNGDLTFVDSTGDTFYLPTAVALPWDVNVGAAVQFGRRRLNPPFRTVSDVAEREIREHRERRLERAKAKRAALTEARNRDERRKIALDFKEAQLDDDADLSEIKKDGARRLRNAIASEDPLYLLISASLLVSGDVDNAVGVESFLAQQVNRSGQTLVWSPRLGAETEIVPRLLRLRGGSYLEPTRFETSTARLHGTVGLDLRLFRWSVFDILPDDWTWRAGGAIDVSDRFFTWGLTLGGWEPSGFWLEKVSVH